jgi:hypothetical protein
VLFAIDIKINLREARCEVVNWINLVQDRPATGDILNMVMNLQVP